MQDEFAAARYRDFESGIGGYESYYLKACAPHGDSAIWIRNTVHQRPGARPAGSLWFTLFERGAPRPYAVKQTFVELSAPGEEGSLLKIADAGFGRGRVYGEARGEGRSAAWDLAVGGGADPVMHLPNKLYGAALPKTKSLTLVPEAAFDGSVTIGDRRISIRDWRGMIGHNWGSQHAEQWNWLYADGLAVAGASGQASGWLDLVAGRVRVGALTAPWVANGFLRLGDERVRVGGIGRIASTRVRPRVGRCEVLLKGEDLRARAIFTAPRDQIVAWRYADPDGSEHHVLNSSLAGLQLSVERKHHAPQTFKADGRAVYEWGTRYTAHGIPVEPFGDG
jgi:hypothetical protein